VSCKDLTIRSRSRLSSELLHAVRARADLRVISGGIADHTAFRFLSATNSLSFRFCGAVKRTLGLDLPSLVRFRSLVSTDRAFQTRKRLFEEFYLRWPSFDSICEASSVRASSSIEGSLSRARVCGNSNARKSGAVLPECNFSYDKEPQLRLPLF